MNDLERAKRCAVKMYSKDTASQSLGIEVTIPKPAAAVATMDVHADMVNGFEICHGGLVFTLADTAFAFACNAYDNLTVASSANIEFVRPAKLGDRLAATASEDHRGEKTGFYTVTVTNQDDELIALFHGRSSSRNEPILEAEK